MDMLFITKMILAIDCFKDDLLIKLGLDSGTPWKSLTNGEETVRIWRSRGGLGKYEYKFEWLPMQWFGADAYVQRVDLRELFLILSVVSRAHRHVFKDNQRNGVSIDWSNGMLTRIIDLLEQDWME